ncbi:mitogen-activated protein kinase kinase kinase 17-like [Benincasa hispida]|uniref:mitogen-activated protein kinase kinase kinase 17-like n=1 Tax=Benincasa hispida TaxID=102211 RepID=UPI0018FFBE05|nr:mitogen-activated protein kinase kinase kinase 17-like [Benincasa hispida]
MKNPFINSSLSPDCDQSLRPKRMITKFPNPNNSNGVQSQTQIDGFDNSHGSFWFRGRLLGKDSSSLRFEKKVLDAFKSCSNVVQCYGHEITNTVSGNYIYNLLLEYCSGGSLYDRITKFGPNGLSELEVRRYTRDIVYGIYSIHGLGYIHCDIKPENILLIPSFDHGGFLVAKIADFGLAMQMTNVVNIDDDNSTRGT